MNCTTTDCTELLLRLLVIGLSNGAIIALNAIAVTLTYSVVRLLNFAHGDMFALTSVLVTVLVSWFGLRVGSSPLLLAGGLLLALGAALGCGALLGVATERVAFRPFRNGPRIAPLIATIGLSFMLYQVALLLRYLTNFFDPTEHRSVPGVPEVPRIRLPDFLPNTNLLGGLLPGSRALFAPKDLLVLLLTVGLALLLHVFLQRSRTGRMLRACAEDPEMAQLCGVDRNRALRLAFALGGVLAGAAAFVYAFYYGAPYTLYGAQSSLIAFMAAVLGGVGRPVGALVAGLLLGVLAAFSDFFLAAQWTPVLLMGCLMLLLFLRPRGLSDEGSTTTLDAPGDVTSGSRNLQRERLAPWVLAGLLLLALAYPALDAAFGLRLNFIVTGMLISVLLALGLNIVLGHAGMLDLGYAAFFGIGAYTAGLLTRSGGPLALFGGQVDVLLLLLICGGLAGLLGAANGALTLRLRGEYLAITTLAFGQIVPQAAKNLDEWTSGSRGLSALPAPHIFGVVLTSPTARYYLVAAMVALVAVGSMLLARSRLGRAWAALQQDEPAALSCGIAPLPTRTLAFVLGAAVAGAAGALFASVFSYVAPDQVEFQLSAMVLAMVVFGGAGSVPGAILGALAVAGYDRLLIPLLGAQLAVLGKTADIPLLVALDLRNLNYLWFGLALYLTTLLRTRRR